jgi:hypothetical protein
MPIYQYENEQGDVIEQVRTVQDRDLAPKGFRRITVPRSLAVVGGRIDPGTPDAAIPKALRDLEATTNHREIARQSGFTTRQLKEIWAI